MAGMASFSAPPTDTDGTWLTGHLLIAMPGMQDPRFDHTVVCLCAHSGDGAMGLVLNRPLSGLSFDDLLRQLQVEPVPPQRRIRMLDGGPVENSRGFVLHSDDWSSEGSLPVVQGLTLTASLDILKAVASGGGPRDCILALGYAGWAPGQLESEIQRNAWLNVPADGSLVFHDDPSHTWTAALAKLRVDPALLSGTAGRA